MVSNLPSSMRQKILRGEDAGEDSLSEGSDDSDEEEEGWGKKKKTYWSGDTADLEIGQDVQDAEDEEDAAMVSSSHWLIFSVLAFRHVLNLCYVCMYVHCDTIGIGPCPQFRSGYVGLLRRYGGSSCCCLFEDGEKE